MDANGKALAYVYGQEDSSAGSQHLTAEEARRIAVNIARIPSSCDDLIDIAARVSILGHQFERSRAC